MEFDRVIEKLIRQAQEDGKFDNLRGTGKPLNLDENPFEDPAAALANQMLKDQGFRPEWLEADVSLRQELSDARRAFVRAREWRAGQLAALGAQAGTAAIQQRELVAHEWRLAQERLRRKLGEINRAIFVLNLKVPSSRFQRVKVDVDAEVQRLIDGGAADPD